MKRTVCAVGLPAFCLTLLLWTAVATAGDVTMAQYSRVEPGMTYSQVVRILGEPDQELSEMAGFTTVMYMWKGTSAGGNMNVMIQNGKLVTKAQFGLK